jgi:hypothetical protein
MASASAAEQPAHHGPWRGRDGAHHSAQNVRLRAAASDRKACPNTRATSKTPTHIRLPEARPASTNAGDRSKVPQCAPASSQFLDPRPHSCVVTKLGVVGTSDGFFDCSDCFRLERLPRGACTQWKAPPLHGARPSLFPEIECIRQRAPDVWLSVATRTIRCRNGASMPHSEDGERRRR